MDLQQLQSMLPSVPDIPDQVAPTVDKSAPAGKTRISREQLHKIHASNSQYHQLRSALENRVPQQKMSSGLETPSNAGGVGAEGRAEADAAITASSASQADSTYSKERARTFRQLDALGLIGGQGGRIHVEDASRDHAYRVARSAFGNGSLAESSEKSIRYGHAPRPLDSDEQWKNERRMGELLAKQGESDLSLDEYTDLHVARLEDTIRQEADYVRDITDALPNDGKNTFINMSMGENAHNLVKESAQQLTLSAKGTKGYRVATEILGHPPTAVKDGDLAALHSEDPKAFARVKGDANTIRRRLSTELQTRMNTPAYQERIGAAKKVLADELAKARKKNALVFMASGNKFDAAADAGFPDFATEAAFGTKGLLLVGAHAQNQVGASDDQVAAFSAPATLTAVGVDIPTTGVDSRGMAGSVDGTSYASPEVTQVAYAMSAANPKLGVEQIEKLILDPRALNDLDGTRDGAGAIDTFAAVLLAANPALSRAQINQARNAIERASTPQERLAVRGRFGL